MAVLRAGGLDFDVDGFLDGCSLPVCGVHRKGEPVFPSTQPNDRRHERSNVNIEVSEGGFDEFARQISDAVIFLSTKGDQIRRLCTWPGVEGVTLDFGVAWREVVTQSDHLPAELVRLAGEFGLALEISHYRISEESTDVEP